MGFFKNPIHIADNEEISVIGMGQVDTTPVLDPDQLTANQLGLLRGLLKQLQDGTMKTEINGSLADHALEPNEDGSINVVATGVELTATNVELSTGDNNIGRVRTQDKEFVAYTYDRIIDEIGYDKVMMFLPCWEESGSVLTDLFNPRLRFSLPGSPGSILGVDGLLHKALTVDAVSTIEQKAITENLVSSAEVTLTATGKLAQRITRKTNVLGFVDMYLKRTGTLATATFKVTICADDSGKPGAAITNGVSDTTNCSAVGTTAGYRGVAFTNKPTISTSDPWIVLEYADATGVDASNYISWAYDPNPTYGQSRSVYDGSWVTTAAQNHRFRLFSNDLYIPDDFTVIICAKNTEAVWEIRNLFRLFDKTNTQQFWVTRINSRLRVQAGVIGEMTGMNADIYYDDLDSQFDVIAVTFSKTNATNKLQSFINGKPNATVDGTAGQGLHPLRHPIQVAPLYKGIVGPIIWCKDVLSDSAIANVSQLLMAKRKFGV